MMCLRATLNLASGASSNPAGLPRWGPRYRARFCNSDTIPPDCCRTQPNQLFDAPRLSLSTRLVNPSIRSEGAVDCALARDNAAARSQAHQPRGVNPEVFDF